MVRHVDTHIKDFLQAKRNYELLTHIYHTHIELADKLADTSGLSANVLCMHATLILFQMAGAIV